MCLICKHSLVSEISDTLIAEEGKSDDYLSQYFPQLMVLIRDMELKLKLKGKQVDVDSNYENIQLIDQT